MRTNRRLAALMFTDMVGYSALARDDEQMARELVDDQRVIVREALKTHDGRELQTTGDGFFIEFASAVNAVECAVQIQTEIFEKSRYLPEDRRIQIRIGIHIGDILTNDQDLFGNSVNIAARIEPMARPGGICITRQVFEQVNEKISGIEFQRAGKTSLKNIRGGAEIFHVRLPHEKSVRKIPGTFSRSWIQFRQQSLADQLNKTAIYATTLISLLLLTFAIAGGLKNVFYEKSDLNRNPASTVPTITDLSEDWFFKTAEMADWSSFDIRKSWQYADSIHGKFQLRKHFEPNSRLQTPSIVLGTIRDRHKVYLNGKYVGGADRHTDLAMYTFDPDLLIEDGQNELLIHVEVKKTLNPGLALLPSVGAALGEFTEIEGRVRSNTIRFHVLRNVYFGLALTVLLGCIGFIAVRRVPMNFFYCFSILLFSTLQLAYYSPWINETFEFPFVRFLKITGLALTSVLLVPAFSRLYGWTKSEAAGNLAAITFFAVSATMFLEPSIEPSKFTSRYNLVLGIALGVSIPWLFVMATKTVLAIIKNGRNLNSAFGVVYLLSSLCLISSMLVALKAGISDLLIPLSLRGDFVDFSLAFPLLFSCFVVGIAIHDYLKQSKSAKIRRQKDSLVLEVSHLISKSVSVTDAIAELQRATCSFVHAARSTIYIVNDSVTDPMLIAEFTLNSSESNATSALPIDRGVIGYTLKHRTPLLIDDIRADRRFSDLKSDYSREASSKYRTGSCMIFPLTSNGRSVGAITFADKENDKLFSKDDFEAALQVSTQFALLIDNRRLAAKFDDAS